MLLISKHLNHLRELSSWLTSLTILLVVQISNLYYCVSSAFYQINDDDDDDVL